MISKVITVVVFAVLIGVMTMPAVAKDDDPSIYTPIYSPRMPAGTYPPPVDAFRRWEPRPQYWIAWWEANRDPYLEVVRQGGGRGTSQGVSQGISQWINQGTSQATTQGTTQAAGPTSGPGPQESFRKQAMEALLAGLKSSANAVRGFAAIALGQMGQEEALEPLIGVAQKDKDVQVRQAAIIAIGLLDMAKGEEVLASLAFMPPPAYENNFNHKPSDRQAALVALGLMRRLSPQTITGVQKMFGQHVALSPISAWALTRPLDPTDPTAPILAIDIRIDGPVQRLREGAGLAASAMSCLALSHSEEAGNVKLLQDGLVKTNVPWLASEAMLALGLQSSKDSDAGLSQVLLAMSQGEALPVFKMLQDQEDRLGYLWKVRQSKVVREDFRNNQSSAIGPQVYREAFTRAIGGVVIIKLTGGSGLTQGAPVSLHVWLKDVFAYRQLHYSGSDYGAYRYKGATIYDYGWLGLGGGEKFLIYHINLGMEKIVRANLRASAAIALGSSGTSTARKALLKVLEEKDDGYSDIYKSMAIMSLGQLCDEDALPALAELVHPTVQPGVVISKDRLQSPLRGHAALAMGLYARPIWTSQHPVDRPNAEKIREFLALRVVDTKEPEDFRAACALALGLGGRTEDLRYLQPASKTIGNNNELLAGYMILARSMLGDRTILGPAKEFLAAGKSKTGMASILGRRAAVLGLGLTGSSEAIPILAGCWGQDRYLSQEIAKALSFCGGENQAARLAGEMNGSGKPEDKALAASCLGILFTKDRPPRLSRLLGGSNYMMRTPRMMFFQAMANEFLITSLLPEMAEKWETLAPN